MWTWFYKLASPPYVYGVAAALTPWFLALAGRSMSLEQSLESAPPLMPRYEPFQSLAGAQ